MINPDLLDAVLERSTGKDSRVHGPAHWAGVAAAGLNLLDPTPDADPFVVLLFALFHDSMRESDGRDPEHGARAARYARELRDVGAYPLDEGRLERLEDALTRHDRGETSADPTIGVCWDADRLNLGRVWKRPDPALLSTAAARALATTSVPDLFAFGAFDWPALFLEYGAKLRGEEPRYLRFGGLPADGRSRAIFGYPEGGVSAYPASARPDGSYVLDFRRLLFGADTRYLTRLLWDGRPLYEVEGSRVGVGSIGEPVLAGARIVREVRPEEVDVLPARPRFRQLIGAWGAKRRGENPDIFAFRGPPEPDERPLLPVVPGLFGLSAIGEQFRELFRGELERRGVLEDFDRMNVESARKRKARAEALARDSPYARGEAVVERWRAFDERVKAMNERYGRMGGGW